MENYKIDIIETRTGGLGSSDAKMVSKVGKTGKLSYSDRERVAVMLGLQEPANFTNAAMENGDYIEGQIFDSLKKAYPNAKSNPYYKHKSLSNQLGFNVFCHIDFEVVIDDRLVWYECKASRYSIDQVRAEYDDQLRWEYMLLNEKARDLCLRPVLNLIHYRVENYGEYIPENLSQTQVSFNDGYDEYIVKGLDLIRQAIRDGFTFTPKADVSAEDLPVVIASQVALARQKLREAAELTAEVDAFKEAALQYCLERGIKSIKGDGLSIIVKDEYTSSRVDSKKLQNAHPDIYNECLKTITNKPSITLKLEK